MKLPARTKAGRRAVVLHSGGLDSTVCLLIAKQHGRKVISLGIDYGQTHRVELEFAKRQCARFGVERKVISLRWDKPKRQLPLGRTVREIRKGVSTGFLPGRNVVFLALGAAEAAGISAQEVWLGVNAVDFSGYPDCRPNFVTAFKRMLKIAIPRGPAVVAPLIRLSKPQIARIAMNLGLKQDDVWFCYRPKITKAGIRRCGRCDACVLHEYAWAKATRRKLA